MMLGLRFFLVLLCLLMPHSLLAWEGRVILVSDGDLITVLHDGREEKLRLFGIDTPDEPQEFGKEAREFTSRSVLGKIVEVMPVGQDRYGNTFAIVIIEGVTLNRELAASGLAWVYSGACTQPECNEWRQVERQARVNGIGLWFASSPIPPWEFRRSGGNANRITATEGAERTPTYHGDIVTHLYHAQGCSEYRCKGCIVEFRSEKDAKRAGYKPCAACAP